MATVLEELNRLKALVHTGHENEVIHVVMTEREAKRRRENPKKSTRLIIETHSPEAYSAFHIERERYFQIAIDPHIAIDLMIRALHEVSDAQLREWISAGDQFEGSGPVPPRAELPPWLQE